MPQKATHSLKEKWKGEKDISLKWSKMWLAGVNSLPITAWHAGQNESARGKYLS